MNTTSYPVKKTDHLPSNETSGQHITDTDQDTALSIIMGKDIFSLSIERYDKCFCQSSFSLSERRVIELGRNGESELVFFRAEKKRN